MSRTKIVSLLTAVMLLFACASRGQAQRFQPFIDPLEFDPDFQFFAPADVGEFGNGRPANTGWYGSFSRTYTWVTRPMLEQSFTEGDFTWGNRLDIGYMTEDNHGWLFSAIHVDGPNRFDSLFIHRPNRVNEDDLPVIDDDDDEVEPVFPVQDRNNILTSARDFESRQSVNAADMGGFELNKVVRLKPYHHGSVLEPFFGFRYIKLRDYYLRDDYAVFDEDGLPLPVLPSDDSVLEEITNTTARWDNQMVGGQVGFRLHHRRSRWVLSGELRVFALQNFQSFNRQTNILRTLYDGVGNDQDVDSDTPFPLRQETFAAHDSEFVWGTDVRAEAAFEVTRDISLIFGVQVMEFVQGIARGNDINFNEEDLQMVSGTVGVSINR